jgi:hypothetical protein
VHPCPVDVFAPDLAASAVAAPRPAAAVEAVVVLLGVVLPRAVLALLRLAEALELGADPSGVDAGDHSRGSAMDAASCVRMSVGCGARGGGCGGVGRIAPRRRHGCSVEDVVDVAAEDRALLLVHLRRR